MTITKSVLSKQIYLDLGFNKQESKEFVDEFFEQLRLCLEANENIKLSGFGSFELRDKNARPGRNPKTGKVVTIEERRVVTFKTGQNLKKEINKNVDEIILE